MVKIQWKFLIAANDLFQRLSKDFTTEDFDIGGKFERRQNFGREGILRLECILYLGWVINLHFYYGTDVAFPVPKEIVEIPKKYRVGLGVDGKDFIHLHTKQMLPKRLHFFRQLLIDLQNILPVHDEEGRCSFLAMLLPQIIIKAIGIDILDLLKLLILPFLFLIKNRLPYSKRSVYVLSKICVVCNA